MAIVASGASGCLAAVGPWLTVLFLVLIVLVCLPVCSFFFIVASVLPFDFTVNGVNITVFLHHIGCSDWVLFSLIVNTFFFLVFVAVRKPCKSILMYLLYFSLLG